jgi:hypothetical protein
MTRTLDSRVPIGRFTIPAVRRSALLAAVLEQIVREVFWHLKVAQQAALLLIVEQGAVENVQWAVVLQASAQDQSGCTRMALRTPMIAVNGGAVPPDN